MLDSNPFISMIPFAVIFVIMLVVMLLIGGSIMSRAKKHHQMFDEIQERAMSEMRKNDGALEHSFYGTAVIKRTRVTRGLTSPGTTLYYITFEKEDGDRLEFNVYGESYGLIAEGDRGTVTHRGTRLVDFKRER